MGLPHGKKMPISPMTNIDADKGLSQETPRVTSEEDKEDEKRLVQLAAQVKRRKKRTKKGERPRSEEE